MNRQPIITSKTKRFINLFIISFIVATTTGSIFLGCSQRSQYKGWLSVEKSPIRVIVVDSEKDIDSKVINDVIKAVSLVPYNNVSFNTKTEVGVHTDYSLQYEDSVSRNANVNANVKVRR